MNSPVKRIVFDCMVYAQVMVSPRGSAGACMQYVRSGQLSLVWSDFVIQEVRELPLKLPKRMKLSPERVEAFIADTAPIVNYVPNVPELYLNPFDSDDSHYVNLAASAQADLITTRDGDLLRLMDQTRDEGRQFRRLFPKLEILLPEAVLTLLRHEHP